MSLKLKNREDLPTDIFMNSLEEQGFFKDGMGSIEIKKLPEGADCSVERIRKILGITKSI